MASGNLQTIKEALEGFNKVKHLLPTSPHTPPEDRSRAVEAIGSLHFTLDRLPLRSRKRKEGRDDEKSNRLDEEGVHLWNLALAARGRICPNPDQDDLLLLAHIKYAAFKFIQAATDSSVIGPFFTRLLNLATRLISDLLEANDLINATNLCSTAAKVRLEQKITDVSLSPDSIETQERLEALLGYYVSRCEMAMAVHNDSLGFVMLTKAAELATNHDMDSENLQNVAHQCWVFGNRLRESDIVEAQPSDWLQKGLDLVAKAEKKGVTPGLQDLQVGLLRSAARMELAKGNIESLERAKSILQKLGAASNTLDPSSVREIKMLNLHILQRQGAKEGSIRESLEDIVSHVQWDEGNDLQSLGRQQLLTKAVSSHGGSDFISEILLSILLSSRKLSEDFQVAHRMEARALDSEFREGPGLNGGITVAELGITDRTEAIACQTILWSLGETLYKVANFKQAAQWFVLGAHPAFRPGGIENFGRCRRWCAAGEASTQYLSFLVAIHTGREIAATTTIQHILNCPDLDGKQLLLMGQAAQEKGMKVALSAALNALLTAMARGAGAGAVAVQALTLVRCLMEMNLPVSATVSSTRSFTTFRLIMDIVQGTPVIETDPELPFLRVTAMFACFTGKVEVYWSMNEGEDKNLLDDLVQYVSQLRPATTVAQSVDGKAPDRQYQRARRRQQDLRGNGDGAVSIKIFEHLVETFLAELEDGGFKLARWTHHLVATLLNRGTPEDIERAYHYLYQVIEVQGSDSRHDFPDEEYRWFASIAYSKGMSKFNNGDNEGGSSLMARRYEMVQQRFGRR
ncbi:hypothetical protein CspeluHIS016_0404480 [Cutaneotrichosporon spelunceum]|uniref:Protein ZIP4 homolog n=1 Tax=Cutaneotrichosporon spelunceum TaxID=1672016 RepID=A0AAD3TVE4_9TREE|nr:hypothetical protein CspeluHIS016_0404480 [Cutaneotrichosporon spelunceum]